MTMGGSSPSRRVSALSFLLSLLGVIALAIGMFGVRYLRHAYNGPKFLDFRRQFAAAHAPTNWTTTYFQWAAFVLAAATVVFAVGAALATAATPALRGLGALVGLAGAAYTLFQPALDGRHLGDYLPYGVGMYLIAGGFVVLATAAAMGSRRRTPSAAAEYDARTTLTT